MTKLTLQDILDDLSSYSWVKGNGTYDMSDDTKVLEAEAAINEYIAEILNNIEQSIGQHTVPEGKHLITRQYVRNTIEFERKRAGITGSGKV